MNQIVVGMGEALWDCLPEGKKIGCHWIRRLKMLRC